MAFTFQGASFAVAALDATNVLSNSVHIVTSFHDEQHLNQIPLSIITTDPGQLGDYFRCSNSAGASEFAVVPLGNISIGSATAVATNNLITSRNTTAAGAGSALEFRRVPTIAALSTAFTFTHNNGLTTLINILGNGSVQFAGDLLPLVDNAQDIGATNLRWRTIHLGPASVVVHNDATNTVFTRLRFEGAVATLDTDATGTTLRMTTAANTGILITAAGVVTIPAATASTSTTTGALVVTGGAGIGGNVFIGGNLDVAGVTTTVHSTTVTITDRLIHLNEVSPIAVVGVPTIISGISIDRGSADGVTRRDHASILWINDTVVGAGGPHLGTGFWRFSGQVTGDDTTAPTNGLDLDVQIRQVRVSSDGTVGTTLPTQGISFVNDNVVDIGGAGVNRPRRVFVATEVVVGATTIIGTDYIRPGANALRSLQIQNAAGTVNLMTVDTTNSRVGFGDAFRAATTPATMVHLIPPADGDALRVSNTANGYGLTVGTGAGQGGYVNFIQDSGQNSIRSQGQQLATFTVGTVNINQGLLVISAAGGQLIRGEANGSSAQGTLNVRGGDAGNNAERGGPLNLAGGTGAVAGNGEGGLVVIDGGAGGGVGAVGHVALASIRGNVGVGMNAPLTLLHLSRDNAELRISSATAGQANWGLVISGAAASTELQFLDRANANEQALRLQRATGVYNATIGVGQTQSILQLSDANCFIRRITTGGNAEIEILLNSIQSMFISEAGTNRVSLGRSSVATGNRSSAFGNTAIATSVGSLAVGYLSQVSAGVGAIAIGGVNSANGTQSSQDAAIAIGGASGGTGARATGVAGIAIGGSASVAGGTGATCAGGNSVAIGGNSTNGPSASAGGGSSIAIGGSGGANSTSSAGTGSIAIGASQNAQGASSLGSHSIAIGSSQNARGADSSGTYAIAIGSAGDADTNNGGVGATGGASGAIAIGSGGLANVVAAPAGVGGAGANVAGANSIAIGSGGNAAAGGAGGAAASTGALVGAIAIGSGGVASAVVGGSGGVGALITGNRGIAIGSGGAGSGATVGGAGATAGVAAIAMGGSETLGAGAAASGAGSIALGGNFGTAAAVNGPRATGVASIALGGKGSANATGSAASSLNTSSIAIGGSAGTAAGADASGAAGIAIGGSVLGGAGATASTTNGIAIGGSNEAGAGARATVDHAIAIGAGSNSAGAAATQNMAIALGSCGLNATAGIGAAASSFGSIAIGAGGSAINAAGGAGAAASNRNAIAIGSGGDSGTGALSGAGAAGPVASGLGAIALGSAGKGEDAVANVGGAGPVASGISAIAIGSGRQGSGAPGGAGASAAGEAGVVIGGSAGTSVGALISISTGTAHSAVAIGGARATGSGASVSLSGAGQCSGAVAIGGSIQGSGAFVSASTGSAFCAVAIGGSANGGGAGVAAGAGVSNCAIAIGGSSSDFAGARASGVESIAIGGTDTAGVAGASATTAASIAIGRGSAATTGNDNIAIGRQATCTANNAGTGESISIGRGAAVSGGQSNIAIGPAATVSANSGGQGNAIAIGQSATSAFNQTIVLGGGSTATATQQMVIGSGSTIIRNVFIGNGVTSASPAATVTINATGASDANEAGSSLIIASGISTGTAVGGPIHFQATDSGNGAGAAQNALVTRMSIANDAASRNIHMQAGTNGTVSIGQTNELAGNGQQAVLSILGNTGHTDPILAGAVAGGGTPSFIDFYDPSGHLIVGTAQSTGDIILRSNGSNMVRCNQGSTRGTEIYGNTGQTAGNSTINILQVLPPTYGAGAIVPGANSEYVPLIIPAYTVQYSSFGGAVTQHRSIQFNAPTLNFNAAMTVTDSTNLFIQAPIRGAAPGPTTLSNNTALWTQGSVRVDVTNAIDAPNALTVGQTRANPAFRVNTAATGTGVEVVAAAAGSAVRVNAISSGAEESLVLSTRSASAARDALALRTTATTIADNIATTVISIALAVNSAINVQLQYGIFVTNAVDIQSESGTVFITAVRTTAGVTSRNFSVQQTQVVSAGTLSVTWSMTAASPLVVQVTIDSSLNVASNITYSLLNHSNQAITYSL